MKVLFHVPEYIKAIQERLIKNEYECYLVGGCIRDTLLGLDVKDYDLTTNCDFSTLKSIFTDYSIINNNGEKHNTITLHIGDDNVEITSYKHNADEKNSIENDLMHRDLTINAMAYSDRIVDLVGGYDDLKNKIIRAPGNPVDRIKEDPLRILRALRFSSRLGFEIEEETARAIHEYKELLSNVSSERIKSELDGILAGDNVKKVLNEYKDVIFTIIPELKFTDGFDQKNPYHNNTLYDHIVHVCGNVYSKTHATGKTIVLTRTAALLHDIAKPLCFTVDDNGIGHFYGHAEKGALIALEVMKRLRYSNDEIEKIQYLIMKHDTTINPTTKSVRKNLSSTPNQDEELFSMLLELINADRFDHTSYELMNIDKIKSIVKQIKEDNECIKLADLSINGYDLIELGMSGKEIGSTLNYLLELVMDDKINNNKEVMIELIKKNRGNYPG
ncbi:MAG: CCA tRNA nucleotidyltransferase [Anaeroplasma sp.]|uniref:CCA tRNA nucleotidyltransferase n=1 Tax=Anaeroplasma sp. TaxID=1872523 RepID=UPI002A9206E3|nr:CCA tRNA nucleotidyltransferase [Anaeroplasma sp.]MDY5983098.1 CCA tRNA nucleotidyltransferase [Anaeroplasma sp.]